MSAYQSGNQRPADCVIVCKVDRALVAGKGDGFSIEDFYERLRLLGEEIGEGYAPLQSLRRLHYLSVCLIDRRGPLFREHQHAVQPDIEEHVLAHIGSFKPVGDESHDEDDVYVVLELSLDGDRDSFLTELLQQWHFGIDQVFEFCRGFPRQGTQKEIVKWLLTCQIEAGAFYSGNYGRTRVQIENEKVLLDKVRDLASVELPRTRSRADLWEYLRTELQTNSKELWLLVQAGVRRPFTVHLNTWSSWQRFFARLKVAVQAVVLIVGVDHALGLLAAAYQRNSPYWVFGVACAVAAIVFFVMRDWERYGPRHLKGGARRGLFYGAVSQAAVVIVWLIAVAGFASGLFEHIVIFLRVAAILALAIFLGIAVYFVGYWRFRNPVKYLPGLILLVLVVHWLPDIWNLFRAQSEFSIPVKEFWQAFSEHLSKWKHELTACVDDPSAAACDLSWIAGELLGYFLALTLVVFALLAESIYRSYVALKEIREREQSDPVSYLELEENHMNQVRQREGGLPQAPLASVTQIQEECSGRLKVVLRIVTRVHNLFMNKGFLADIPSIHFARWFILPDDWDSPNDSGESVKTEGRLVFMTNYDGDFAGYLGDFQSVPGTTMVWSNTVGFPRSYMLAWDGARSEQLFKNYSRNSQIETLIWFSAYPRLTVQEIDHATAVCEALKRPLMKPGKGLKYRWWCLMENPISEAEISQLMRDHLKVR